MSAQNPVDVPAYDYTWGGNPNYVFLGTMTASSDSDFAETGDVFDLWIYNHSAIEVPMFIYRYGAEPDDFQAISFQSGRNAMMVASNPIFSEIARRSGISL